jgi:hypothetical protein
MGLKGGPTALGQLPVVQREMVVRVLLVLLNIQVKTQNTMCCIDEYGKSNDEIKPWRALTYKCL